LTILSSKLLKMNLKGLARLATLLPLVATTLAQSCWKNTTCSGPADTAFPGQWESNIYAPASRAVSPKSILSAQNGEVISEFTGSATVSGCLKENTRFGNGLRKSCSRDMPDEKYPVTLQTKQSLTPVPLIFSFPVTAPNLYSILV
jgi:hypothetical protein